ncbi:MAG: hypothetical protein HY722_15050 [Planctomycetes bacterium]|nr:hypothetical protein [Planctomycetota bacterium]
MPGPREPATALGRAVEASARAARTGFDWPGPTEVLRKLEEEAGELGRALAADDAAAVEEELGDLLFAAANLARKLGVGPEAALEAATDKFQRRFERLQVLRQERGLGGPGPGGVDLDALEGLWAEVKRQEREGRG